ncbi:TonB-dependent receptor [Rubrivirga sp. IMCC45206]|uniref:TonB-dependent receptor n=1 Tax=Rubrivirga sp. IMCC45206 TaxID=3391614 RepID=UPI00398FBB92
MQRLWLGVLALLLAGSAHAQTGKVSGTVVDTDGLPIIGASVLIVGTTQGASTDVDGVFTILNVTPGTYDVRAAFVGLQTVVQEGVVVNNDRTTELDFTLAPEDLTFEGDLVVTAERPEIEPERTASSEIIRPREVSNAPGVYSLTDVIGLTVEATDGHFRGGRTGEELYLLNGINIVNPFTGARSFDPIANALEEVEVITGGFPAQYGNAQSGVINMAMQSGAHDQWEGTGSVRVRAPGYKHFGGSVFSLENNPYLLAFDSVEEWGGDSGEGLYSCSIGLSFCSAYGLETAEDSLQAAQIAQAVWAQAREELGAEYDDRMDSQIDLSVGGPVSDRVRAFIGARFADEWYALPTDSPERTRQLLGSARVALGGGASLQLAGAYNRVRGHDFTSSFWQYLWDRERGFATFDESTLGGSARLAYVPDERRFVDLTLSVLRNDYESGAAVLDPARFREDASDLGVWRFFNTPDQFRVGYMENDFRNERSSTYSLDATYNDQITNNHLLKGGIQGRLYHLDVDNRLNLSSPSDAQDETFRVTPFELGAFVEDKVEYEGLIARLGLRFDAYNLNTEFFADRYNPYLNPDFDPTQPAVGDNAERDPDLAVTERTSWIARLQPRLGASFPISVNTVFHLNYGAFLQRPPFERSLVSRIQRSNALAVIQLGNPELEPEETKMYEVGVAQGLPGGLALDLSGYYKDVRNLVQLAFFSEGVDIPYQSYVNRDYADIRGFRVSLQRRRGAVRGSVRYRYEVATGKTSSAEDAPPQFIRGLNGEVDEQRAGIGLNDILLDFDRTHNLIVQLTATTPRALGPQIAGVHPLGRWTASVRSRARSGRPYTSFAAGQDVLVADARAPMEYQTSLKVTRPFRLASGAEGALFAEVANLFNQRAYDYNRVFRDVRNLRAYDFAVNPSDLTPDGFTDDPDEALALYLGDSFPYEANQTFRIYDNAPRSFFFGLSVDL